MKALDEIIGSAIIIYLTVSIVYFFMGIALGDLRFVGVCRQPSRLSIVFPAAKLGCWLGAPAGSK